MTRGPRNGHRYRQACAQVKREEPTCWLCHQWIDPTLPTWPTPHPLSFTADHVIPVHHGGSNDRTNLRAAHRRCNEQRQRHCELCHPQPTQPLVTSRRW